MKPIFQIIFIVVLFASCGNSNEVGSNSSKLEEAIYLKNFHLISEEYEVMKMDLFFHENNIVGLSDESNNTGEVKFEYIVEGDDILIDDSTGEITLHIYDCKINEEGIEGKAEFYGLDTTYDVRLIEFE